MDLLTPKQLREKTGIYDRMHKEKTLKTLLAYNKVKQAFNELKLKIKDEKNKVLLDYSNFIENKNEEKQIVYREIREFEQKKDKLFKPLREKEKTVALKIEKNEELFNAYEKLEKIVNEKIEKNQIILDNSEKARSYCKMNEKNNSIKNEELLELENRLKNEEKNINNLAKRNLTQIEEKNKEIEKREILVSKREMIVKSNQEVIDLKEIELRHIRIKLQDEREALNRAKQEINK